MTHELTLNNYQLLAARTCPDLGDKTKNLRHMKLGVATEIGELLDTEKRLLAYGKPIDYVNYGEEIGDICWYLANKARLHNQQLPYQLRESNVTIKEDCPDWLIDHGALNMSTVNFLANLKWLAMEKGLNFGNILYRNIEKLKVRFPDKFLEDKALNRDLDSERKTLE